MIHVILCMSLLGITHLFCLAAMTEPKYSAGKTFFIYSLFCIVFVGLTTAFCFLFRNNLRYVMAPSYFITMLVALAVFMFASADLACKKIFLFISYSNIFSIFYCISVIICGVFFLDLSNIGMMYLKHIIRTVLSIPAVLIYIRFLRPTVRMISGRQKKTWYSISLVSILFLAVFAMLLTAFHASYDRVEKYIPFFAAAAVIYCSVLWIVFGTIRSMLNENKMELISHNLKYMQSRLESARENELFAKTIRHDLHHHCQNIEVMLEKGEIREALRYLRQYNESLDAAKPREFCPNVTVNAILNSFYSKALNEGISLCATADVQRETPISDIDFAAILSNLLENAVNGCKECGSDGKINVNIKTVAGKTVIVCSNPCSAELSIENNLPKQRGVGIDSIVLAARKYNGDISYSLENRVLTVCVILKA